MLSERHLILQELVLQPGCEWRPSEQGWTAVQVAAGVGYFLQASQNRELQVGDGLACTGKNSFVIRASSLGQLRLEFFLVHPENLHGLLTVSEGHHLELAEKHASGRLIFFGAGELVGQKFARLAGQSQPASLTVRAALLQLWSQIISGVLPAQQLVAQKSTLQERFRQFVAQLPDQELSTRPLSELAAQLNCSERHFSRLFRLEFGVALRTRQTELRLQRASQLLAAPAAKIASVAQESGYRHIGLFNLMFKKQFGMTPSAWRQKLAATQVLY